MTEHFHAVMDRSIFKLDLPIETTSAYILIASLLEQSVRPTLEEIRQDAAVFQGIPSIMEDA